MSGGDDTLRAVAALIFALVMVVSVLSVPNMAVQSDRVTDRSDGAMPVQAHLGPVDTNSTDAIRETNADQPAVDRSRWSELERRTRGQEPSLVEQRRPDAVRQDSSAPVASTQRSGDDYSIEFKAGAHTPQRGLATDLIGRQDTDREEPVWVVVQFDTDPDADSLRQYGYEFEGFLSENAQFAGIPAENLSAVATLPFVRSVTSIRAEWRIEPALYRSVRNGDAATVSVSVSTFEPISHPRLSRVDAGLYRGQLGPDAVVSLTKNERVKWIERYREPKPTVTEGRDLVAADRVNPIYDGSGVAVGVVDSGIDHDHPHFDAVGITDAKDWVDDDTYPEDPGYSHGVHVAGTITGQGVAGTETITGVAPDADLVVSRVFNETGDWYGGSYADIFNDVNSRGAQIISNSWGHSSNEAYDLGARRTDRWARNNPNTLLVFSNGNYPDTFDMESPALSKNVVAVGAVQDGSNRYGDVQRGTIDETAVVSDLNNLDKPADGREKPDVNAPGEWISGPIVGGVYDEYVGTSMAAPHVSGVAAMYKDAYGDVRSSRVKASLVATADPVRNPNGYPVGRSGLVNAHNAIYNNVYESTQSSIYGSISEDETHVFNFTVPEDAEKVVVTLTWLDPPAETNTQNSLVNKLDLFAGPTGDTNRHYDFAFEDNVAKLVVENPESGKWSAKVYGFHVSDLFGFGTQSYDGTIRVVTDEPGLSVVTSNVTMNSTERASSIVSLSGEGAPAAGTYVTIDAPDALNMVHDTLADGTECAPAQYIAGSLSAGYADSRSLCFQSEEFGTHTVTVEVDSTNVPRKTETLTVEVAPDPVCAGCSVANDPDGDGLYEDVDGNGVVDFTDVVLLYQEQEEGDASLAFDFDENGKVDFTDVVLLYQEQN